MRHWIVTLSIPVLLVLSGCSISSDSDEVSVKHSVNQDIVGKWAAETYCAKQGKKPKLLMISPTTSTLSTLYFRTKTSTYACVKDNTE